MSCLGLSLGVVLFPGCHDVMMLLLNALYHDAVRQDSPGWTQQAKHRGDLGNSKSKLTRPLNIVRFFF